MAARNQPRRTREALSRGSRPTRELYLELGDLDSDLVAAGDQTWLHGAIEDLRREFDNAMQFDVTKDDAGRIRTQHVKAAESRFREGFGKWHTYLAYHRTHKPSLEALCDEITERTKEASKLIDLARKTAAGVVTNTHAKRFESIGKAHDKYALAWLASALVLTALTLWLLLGDWTELQALAPAPEGASVGKVAHSAITRILVISFLSASVLLSVRSYRAHRHNRVVNEHRCAALGTFELFAGSAADQETKNAVLLKAAEAVFAPTVTGYIDKEPPPSASPIAGLLKALPKSQ